jgi:coproporphyrinogen III oxidase-like Fe-S oxidoreductase
MNGFRLVDGFGPDLFEARTGLEGGTLDQALAPALARGLVVRDPRGWRATPRGFRFLNEILVDLLPGTGAAAPS